MMIKKNTEIDINNILKDYKEQLKLMNNQHGLEDELYPWIYMLLWESGKVANLSMRQVAGGSWTDKVLGREMLRGYAGFPDIAIMDKEFCAINLDNKLDDEVKSIIIEWIEKESPIKEVTYEINNKSKSKKIDDKTKEFLQKYWYLYNIDKIKGCVEAKILEDTLINIQSGEYDLSIEYRENRWIFKVGGTDYPSSENKEGFGDLVQLFGELLWYGRVLYTNGKQWKYLEVTECFKESKNGKDKEINNIVDLRRILYGTCVKFHEPLENWYERIARMQEQENELKIKIKCENFSNEIKDDGYEKNIMKWIGGNVSYYERKFTIKDYFEQLKLMEQQYGLEEELYPFINIFLNNIKEKEISIRTVAKGRKDEKHKGNKLIKGGVGFPDIALLKKEFSKDGKDEENIKYILGCVEAKEMTNNKTINIKGEETIKIISGELIIVKPSEKSPHYHCYTMINPENKGELLSKVKQSNNIKISELKGMNLEWHLCNENDCKNAEEFKKLLNTNDKDKEYPIHFVKSAYIEIGSNNYQILKWNEEQENSETNTSERSNDDKVTSIGQLLGELFWYGKVLYTNGLIWKYFEITKCGEDLTGDKAILHLRKQIYDKCINGDKKWYEIVGDVNASVKCTDIADLTEGYEVYKKSKNQLMSEQNKEWDKLITGLAEIKWIPENKED